MGSGFPTEISPRSTQSALNLNQSTSRSSSSVGSQGLPVHLSTSDSGFCGNELLLRPGGQHSERDFPPAFREECPPDGDGDSDHSDNYLGSGIREAEQSPPHVNGFSNHQEDHAVRQDVEESSEEDVYPEELPMQLRSPRLKGSQQHVKKHPLRPSSLRFDAAPQAQSGLQSPVASKRLSFPSRRASMDYTLIKKTHAEQRYVNPSSVKKPMVTLGPTRRASMDQGLLSSQTVLNHLMNIHRKSQTENPMLSSMEEEQEATLDSPSTERHPSSRHLSQYDSPRPQSPEPLGYQTPTRMRRMPIPLNAIQPKTHTHPLVQTGSPDSSTLSSLTPRTMLPSLSFSLMSESQSPPSPRTQMAHALTERLAPMQDATDSRRSSISDCSSFAESTRSSDMSDHLNLFGHDLSQSATASDYAPSVFSDETAPFVPLIDQRVSSLVKKITFW